MKNMNTFLGSGPFWILLIGGLTLLYFSPVIIGVIRRVELISVIIVLNVVPILWPAALLSAFMQPRRDPRYPLYPSPGEW